MDKRRAIYLTCLFLGLTQGVSTVCGVAVAAEPRTPAFSSAPDAVKSRLDNVRRLVTTSTGARRVSEGSNAAARAKREEAERSLDAADAAFAKGDMAAAQRQLDAATASMFAAVRLVGTGKEGLDKKNRDFEGKAASVDVLLNAVERVATEKGGRADVLKRAAAVRARADAARAQAAAGKIDAAREAIDSAYEEAKLELEKLREGETLVRRLEFANAEEEYRYELDRNETHQMLLKVLTAEKEPAVNVRREIDALVVQSRTLRKQADDEAGSGAYERAVKSLEQSTQRLQRAIRSAGVYIPG